MEHIKKIDKTLPQEKKMFMRKRLLYDTVLEIFDRFFKK